MLDKIINIKPNFGYKEGKGRHPGFQKYFQTANYNKSAFHDSISFSPAAIFLSKVNWNLKEIDILTKEKINLIFSISEFEFKTEIDFLTLYSEPRHFYTISKDYSAPGNTMRLILNLSAQKNIITLNENIDRVFLNGLDKLFGRMLALEICGEIDKYDSSALRNLMDGIDDEIALEFEYINTALFTLVNKLGNKIIENYSFQNERVEPIIIEKITALNG